MKKILLLITLILIPINVSAKKEEVILDNCIDGDTVSVISKKDNKTFKVRFLAIDSPELDLKEPYSTEAKEFTCEILSRAKKIYLEKDINSDEYDKYERKLAWVWADKTLVQKELVKKGYAKVAYLYDKYKYVDELKELENKAKENKLNVWNEEITTTPAKKKNKTKKIRINKDTILDKVNKYFDIVTILIAMIASLITMKIMDNKKSKKRIKK